MTEAVAVAPPTGRTLAGLARYFAKLGSWGFGGPIALVGYMHRRLVEDRGWYTEDASYKLARSTNKRDPAPRSPP